MKENYTVQDLDILNSISKDILSTLDLKELLQKAINSVVEQYGFLGGLLFLVENNELYTKTISSSQKSQKFLSLIGSPLNSLKIKLDREYNNFVVNAVLDKKTTFSFELYDFTRGVLGKTVTSTAAFVTGTKASTAIPILFNGNTIGALFFAQSEKEEFNELPMLNLIANFLGVAIINARRYENIKETLRKERDMLDILAHELRTPLTIGRNGIKVLKDKANQNQITNEIALKYLNISEENLDREAKILETMLSTSKIDNNQISLVRKKVNLVDIINKTIQGYEHEASQKQLELIFTPPKESLVFADIDRLQEVIYNLVDNAIKYTNKGQVEIKIELEGGHTKVSVMDTGIGISKEDLKQLGKKVYRANTYVNTSTSTGYTSVRAGGTGLGIYVASHLVKAMGGELKVNSELGKGSTFSFTMPTYTNQQEDVAKKSGEKLFERFQKMKQAGKNAIKNPNILPA